MSETVNSRLKQLRLAAKPKLSIRAMAEALDLPTSSYVYFEDEQRFKKRALPIDFTRRVAQLLSGYGVDPAKVMALAGLTDKEAEPEARAISRQAPPLQFVQMAVAMPSAAALTEMFDAMLRGLEEPLPRAELARALALRLPTALGQLQGPLLDSTLDAAQFREAAAPPPATDRPGSPSPPRS